MLFRSQKFVPYSAVSPYNMTAKNIALVPTPGRVNQANPMPANPIAGDSLAPDMGEGVDGNALPPIM